MTLQEKLLNANMVDLSHQVNEDIPHFPIFHPSHFEQVASIADNGFYAGELTMPTQYGTHIDVPGHFYEGGRLLDEIRLDELILPLIVLDFHKEVETNPLLRVDKEDVQAWESDHGSIESGTFVALRTDWYKRFSSQEAMNNADENGNDQVPGWGLSALEYLHEAGVSAIGTETLNTDASVDYVAKGGTLDAEYYWLSKDHIQLEVMANLDKVPVRGATIVISPVNYKGAPGISCRPLAFFE